MPSPVRIELREGPPRKRGQKNHRNGPKILLYQKDENGCWIVGTRGRYPAIIVDGIRYTASVLITMMKGEWEEGYHVHHKCGEPSCINPDHLVVISPRFHKEVHEWMSPR